jgi:hypothetical protein
VPGAGSAAQQTLLKTESLSSLSSLSVAQLDEVAEPTSPLGGGDSSPVLTAAVAALAQPVGPGPGGPTSAGGGLHAGQVPPSPAAASPPAAVTRSMTPLHQPSEQAPDFQPSPVSLPVAQLISSPHAADGLHPVQISSAAARVQLPPLNIAEALPAQHVSSSARADGASTAASEPGPVEYEALEHLPERPALQAHMVALAEAEKLEQSLLIGMHRL